MSAPCGCPTEHEPFCKLLAERDALAAVAEAAREVVDGLWFDAETTAEAYLQQELRKLHAVIEAAYDRAVSKP